MKKLAMLGCCMLSFTAFSAEEKVTTATPDEIKLVSVCFDIYDDYINALEKTYHLQVNVLEVLNEFNNADKKYKEVPLGLLDTKETQQFWENKRNLAGTKLKRIATSGKNIGERSTELKNLYERSCKYHVFNQVAVKQVCSMPDYMTNMACNIRKR